jgi:CheY-like chemotaxis protein/signal transduction histidine kinase
MDILGICGDGILCLALVAAVGTIGLLAYRAGSSRRYLCTEAAYLAGAFLPALSISAAGTGLLQQLAYAAGVAFFALWALPAAFKYYRLPAAFFAGAIVFSIYSFAGAAALAAASGFIIASCFFSVMLLGPHEKACAKAKSAKLVYAAVFNVLCVWLALTGIPFAILLAGLSASFVLASSAFSISLLGSGNGRYGKEASAEAASISTGDSNASYASSLESQIGQHGKVAGDIAHDINNVLTPVIGRCEMALERKGLSDDAYIEIKHALAAANRAKVLMGQLLAHYKDYTGSSAIVNLPDLLKDSLKIISQNKSLGVSLHISTPIDDLQVMVVPENIHKIIFSVAKICGIASEAKPNMLTVEQSIVHIDENIAPLNQGIYSAVSFIFPCTGKLLDMPGFLDLESSLAEANGGALLADIVAGVARVQLFLPAYFGEASIETPLAEVSMRSETIMVIDDEKPIAQMLKQRLSGYGYNVEAYTEPLSALEAYSLRPCSYHLLVTDFTMPNLSGTALSKAVLAKNPEQKILLVTGYSDQVSEKLISSLGIRAIAYKPFDFKKLELQIRRLLDTSQIDIAELQNNLY